MGNPEAEDEIIGAKDIITSESLREMIKSTVKKMGPQFSKEQKKEHAKLLLKIFEQGMSPREAMGIADQEIAQIYSYAYHLFSSGKYPEAKELFKMLLTLEPTHAGFATALGVCHHRLKEYEMALECYMLSAALNGSDPVPLFYAYDCCSNLKDPIPAGIMLCNVISRAGDQPLYAKIKERAQLLLDELQKQIIQQQAQE